MKSLKAAVNTLDIFYWINGNFRDKINQVEHKEFINEAVNTSSNLDPEMQQWAKLTGIQVRNNQPVAHSNIFNVCAFHWIISAPNKRNMLEKYNKAQQKHNVIQNLLRVFWDPVARKKNPESHQRYQLEVRRDDILEDSLQNIVKVLPKQGIDQLKLPFTLQFAGEPGIDMGGV